MVSNIGRPPPGSVPAAPSTEAPVSGASAGEQPASQPLTDFGPSATTPPAASTEDGPAAGTLPASPGPGSPAEVARALLGNAERSFEKVARRYGPWPLAGYNPAAPILSAATIAQFPDLKLAADQLLTAAHEHLTAAGVQHHLHLDLDVLELGPDLETPLGQFAAKVAKLGTRTLFSPAMLWNQRAIAHHVFGNLFLSSAAIHNLEPRGSEAHEALHARSAHLTQRLGQHHPLDAWLLPIGDTPLFGTHDDYTRGFCLEELATEAMDLRSDAAPLDEFLRDQKAGRPLRIELLQQGLKAVQRHQVTWDRPRLAARVLATVERLLLSLEPSPALVFTPQASQYYLNQTVLIAGRYPPRQVLKAELPAEGHSSSVELTTHWLSFKPQEVADVLLVDGVGGAQLELHVVDPAALAPVQAALGGGSTSPESLRALVAGNARAELVTLAKICEELLAKYKEIAAATAALEQLLAPGAATPTGAVLRGATETLIKALDELARAERFVAEDYH